jgi:hypothetical protein
LDFLAHSPWVKVSLVLTPRIFSLQSSGYLVAITPGRIVHPAACSRFHLFPNSL